MAKRTQSALKTASDYRKAAAGALILQGKSSYQALTSVGYAPSTARVPKANGLSAEQCVKMAKKAGIATDSAKIVRKARGVLTKQLQALEDDPEPLGWNPSKVARIVEVAEKYHGGHREAPDANADAHSFVDRVQWLETVLAEIKRRGIGQSGRREQLDAAPIDVEAQDVVD